SYRWAPRACCSSSTTVAAPTRPLRPDPLAPLGTPIEVTAEDLPEGVAATTVVSHPADASAKVVTIELRAEASARSGP
ncbi:hypothetical protein, partial [Mycobacterium tuberculosis]